MSLITSQLSTEAQREHLRTIKRNLTVDDLLTGEFDNCEYITPDVFGPQTHGSAITVTYATRKLVTGAAIASTDANGGVRRFKVTASGAVAITDGGAGSISSGSGTNSVVALTSSTGALVLVFTYSAGALVSQIKVEPADEYGPVPLLCSGCLAVFTYT